MAEVESLENILVRKRECHRVRETRRGFEEKKSETQSEGDERGEIETGRAVDRKMGQKAQCEPNGNQRSNESVPLYSRPLYRETEGDACAERARSYEDGVLWTFFIEERENRNR